MIAAGTVDEQLFPQVITGTPSLKSRRLAYPESRKLAYPESRKLAYLRTVTTP
jgi:hypothetical protein